MSFRFQVRFSLLALLVFGGGCARSVANHECTDGIDNDNDGKFDLDDPGCRALGTFESPDPKIAACKDGIDNDDDGMVDLADNGCFDLSDGDEFEVPPANCRDGLDNDGDGWTDWPNDPGCGLNLEDSEVDDCPAGPHCPACANDKDDDGDGKSDFPEDLGCNSAGDRDEFNADPSICGASVRVLPLAAPGEVVGSLLSTSSNDLISPTCGGAGPETVYVLELAAPRAVRATTRFPETELDTVLYLRGACRQPATELACNDDDPEQEGVSTLFVERVEPGQHFLVVDAFRPTKSGMYKLAVELFLGAGEQCIPGGEPCAPGFVCRKKTADAPFETCEPPECRDGNDNDGDGKIDFPNEPGCADTEDNTELDDCPDGPGCPQCGNQRDDDADGQIDLGADPGCAHAADPFELDACANGEDAPALPFGLTNGNLQGASQHVIGCPFGGGGPDEVWGLILDRPYKKVTLSTVGALIDTTLAVRPNDCDDPSGQVCVDLANGGETLTLNNPAMGGYYVFVDSDFGAGTYPLLLQAVVALGEACVPGDANVTCENGAFCDAGTNKCQPAPCANGADDDGDGKIDWPNDPGCGSLNDTDETDDCPAGPGCPACANTADDDADGKIDFGADIGCAGAGDTDEKDCAPEPDPIVPITGPVTTGNTSQLGINLQGSCGGNFGRDAVHVVSFPGKLKELRADTLGSFLNTVLYVRQGACDGEDLACNDDIPNGQNGESKLNVPDVAAGTYFIVVDSPFSFGSNYTLNVQGVVAAGAACDPAQIASGLAVCESGFFCDGATCVISDCHDQVDNDGDGKSDFPAEPGCESPSDDSEADDCPDGETCPACSNGADDEGDGKSDFPADSGCTSASDNLEIDPCTPDTPVLELTDEGASGTTGPMGNVDHFVGSCHAFGFAPEVVYAYQQKRDLETLTVSTVGSAGDTVLYVRTGNCADATSEVGCANQFPNGETLEIQAPNQGTYYVFVDGTFNGNVGYKLGVSGQLANGASCDPASTQFVCAIGFACDGGTQTCTPTACNNGVDDDGDGKADANDPGCDSIADTGEDPDPATAPACANGVDDDNDGKIDFPDDIGCSRASDPQEENCAGETDPILPIDAQGVSGTTQGANDNFTATCATSNAPDRVYEVIFPGALDGLTVDTFGSVFDTILTVKQGSCAGAELGCNDQAQFTNQSELILGPQPAGLYIIIVDGFFSSQGDYTVNVNAKIKSGEPCNPVQISAGIASCPQGQSCTGGICQ